MIYKLDLKPLKIKELSQMYQQAEALIVAVIVVAAIMLTLEMTIVLVLTAEMILVKTILE